jgi:hypothetical protein
MVHQQQHSHGKTILVFGTKSITISKIITWNILQLSRTVQAGRTGWKSSRVFGMTVENMFDSWFGKRVKWQR